MQLPLQKLEIISLVTAKIHIINIMSLDYVLNSEWFPKWPPKVGF